MKRGKGILLLLVFLIVAQIVLAREVTIPSLFVVENQDTSDVFNGEKSYFYAGGNLIASKSGKDLEYHYNNFLGSDINSRQLPFGQELYSDERFSFTGKELDDSSLYYFGARYYDSNLGKFTSVDPIKENHAYSYVANNPLGYIDPTGKWIESIVDKRWKNEPERSFYHNEFISDLNSLFGINAFKFENKNGNIFESVVMWDGEKRLLMEDEAVPYPLINRFSDDQWTLYNLVDSVVKDTHKHEVDLVLSGGAGLSGTEGFADIFKSFGESGYRMRLGYGTFDEIPVGHGGSLIEPLEIEQFFILLQGYYWHVHSTPRSERSAVKLMEISNAVRRLNGVPERVYYTTSFSKGDRPELDTLYLITPEEYDQGFRKESSNFLLGEEARINKDKEIWPF